MANRRIYLTGGLIALITFLVYLPALQGEFVDWDDDEYILDNTNIRHLNIGFFKWAFQAFHSANWHPLTWLSHASDYALWGLNSTGHHLTSVIVHSANTFLIFVLSFFLIGISNWNVHERNKYAAAFISALLFGIHPVHVESVAWVSERKDLLYSFFYILSLLFYIKYISDRAEYAGSKKITRFFTEKFYLLSLISFILSLMSKPMAVTLPVVLLITDWYQIKTLKSHIRPRNIFTEKIPFFVLSCMSAVITILAQQSVHAIASLKEITFSMRIFVVIKALYFYISKMVMPVDMIPFYPYPAKPDLLSLEFLISLFFVTAITVIAIATAKKHKAVLIAWIYYITALLPVLGIVQVGQQAVAIRYAYMPAFGPFLLLGIGMVFFLDKIHSGSKIILSRHAIFAFSVIITALLTVATIKQIRIWRNPLSLWSHQISVAPDVPEPYHSRGNALKLLQRYDEALNDFDAAIRLDPAPSPDYFNDRGIVYMQLGRYKEAAGDFSSAISINPAIPEFYINRGNANRELRKFDEAIEDFSTAERLKTKQR